MPSTPRDISELAALVDLGVAAAQYGRHERARRYLEAALAIDPAHEDALLWLAAITDDRDRAHTMVRRALSKNPTSRRAQAALRWLDQPAADTSAPPEAGAPRRSWRPSWPPVPPTRKIRNPRPRRAPARGADPARRRSSLCRRVPLLRQPSRRRPARGADLPARPGCPPASRGSPSACRPG